MNNPVVFLLFDPDLAVFNKFPDWLQTKIKGNLNYNGSKLQGMLGEKAEPEEEAPVETGSTDAPAPPAPPAPPVPEEATEDVPQ